jgi:hypothetical protein
LEDREGVGNILLGGICEKCVVTVANGRTWLRIVEFEAVNLEVLLT